MGIRNIVIAMAFVVATSLSGYGQTGGAPVSVDQVMSIMDSSDLSNEQKAAEFTALINATPGAKDSVVAMVVAAVMLQDEANAPQIISGIVDAVNAQIAQQVVATVALQAPLIAEDAAALTRIITSEIWEMVQDPVKVNAIMSAAENPAGVIDVTIAKDGVSRITSYGKNPGVTADKATDAGSTVAPVVIIPEMPNEIVGYGGQTAP